MAEDHPCPRSGIQSENPEKWKRTHAKAAKHAKE